VTVAILKFKFKLRGPGRRLRGAIGAVARCGYCARKCF